MTDRTLLQQNQFETKQNIKNNVKVTDRSKVRKTACFNTVASCSHHDAHRAHAPKTMQQREQSWAVDSAVT